MFKRLFLLALFTPILCWANSPLELSNWDFDAINASHKVYDIDHKNMGDTPPYLIPFSPDHLLIFDSKRKAVAKLKVGELAGAPIKGKGFNAFVVLKNGWVKEYDLKTGQVKAEIKVGLAVANAALSGDGRVLLVGNQQPADLVFLNTDDLHVERIIPVTNYKGRMSAVAAVRNAGDDHGFIVVAKDFIKLWKISYLNPPPIGFGDGWNHDYRCLKEHVDKPLFPVKRLKIKQKLIDFYMSDDATFLVGKSADGKGLIMDLDLSRVIERPDYLSPFPNSLWKHEGSNQLTTLSKDKSQLVIYSDIDNPRHWNFIKKIAVEQVTAVGSCSQSDLIWLAEKSGNIKLISKINLEVEKELQLDFDKPLSSIACSGDGKYMFLEAGREVAVFDNLTEKVVKILSY